MTDESKTLAGDAFTDDTAAVQSLVGDCDPAPPDPTPPDPTPPDPTPVSAPDPPAPPAPPDPGPTPDPTPTAPSVAVATKPAQFLFVIVDHTTAATPDAMRPAQAFQAMIDAWSEQISGPFADAHGARTVEFRIADPGTDRLDGELAMNFRDTIPEAPNALAYHQVVNGVPDIELGVDLFSALTSGSESLSCGGSHELLELLLDAGANGWKDKQDGSGLMGAEEACDVVQNTFAVASNGVAVSNFLLPSYFIPGSAGPWDDMEVMTSQTDLSNGYEIQAGAPTAVSQASHPGMGLIWHPHPTMVDTKIRILGNLPQGNQKKRKSHRYSRSYRRGARFF